MYYDLVAYHPHNPDTEMAGCQNTGEAGDGVVFLNVEPLVGSYMFIGRHSIVEAVAALFDITPHEVLDRLADDAPNQLPSSDALKDGWAKAQAALSGAYDSQKEAIEVLRPLIESESPAMLPPMQAKPNVGSRK